MIDERYIRQARLPEVGAEGQKKLAAASVLIVGAGALGLPAAMALTAAGVGRISLVDGDRVERSNLHRQFLYTDSDIGKPKTETAARRLRAMNPGTTVVEHQGYLRAGNAVCIARGHDVIIDAADNFPARYLCNDLGFHLGIPVAHASILRFFGQIMVLAPHLGGPCYRCLWPTPPEAGVVPGCAEAGVIGALPGILGNWQAMETIKWLLGAGTPLVNRLIAIDTLSGSIRTLKTAADPQCPLCSGPRNPELLRDEDATCGAPWARPHSSHSSARKGDGISCRELASRLAAPDSCLLVDVREPGERALGTIPGSLAVPMRELDASFDKLCRQAGQGCEIIFFCQSGLRSARASALFQKSGFPRCRNLEGGYEAWLKLKT